MKTRTFWLSYDLGLKGDYDGLYRWLDNLKARECGDSLAFFNFDCTSKFLAEIKHSISSHVNLAKTDRIYLIWHDSEAGFQKGRFIIGNRKHSPWEGFGDSYEGDQEDS